MSEIPIEPRHSIRGIPHYYGNTVRRLFILAVVILVLGLPVFNTILPVSPILLVTGIVILILFASFTNPKLRWVNVADVFLSASGVIIFEYLAIINYVFDDVWTFAIRQALAIIFCLALYYSGKTMRAMATGQITPETLEEHDEPEEKISNEELLHRIDRSDTSF
jgi:hypothetical protein